MLPSETVAHLLTGTDERLAARLDAVVRELAASDAVLAVAVSGSVAAGTADRYSDLDLQCVVATRDASTAAAVREAVHATHAVGDERWSVPDRILSTVALDWLRLDVTVLGAGEPLAHDAVVVWRRDEASEPPRASPPRFRADADDLRRRITRFLRSLGLMVRDVRRGDLRMGCWATELLIDELVSLMYLERGLVRGAQKGTYQQLPVEDVAVVQHLPVALPEPSSIVAAHVAVAEAYLPRARRLAHAWGAPWPAAMEEATRRYLEEHVGATFRTDRPT